MKPSQLLKKQLPLTIYLVTALVGYGVLVFMHEKSKKEGKDIEQEKFRKYILVHTLIVLGVSCLLYYLCENKHRALAWSVLVGLAGFKLGVFFTLVMEIYEAQKLSKLIPGSL